MIEFQTKQHLEESLCNRISEIIVSAIREKGVAIILLSGGETPKDLYRRLSLLNLEWSKVKIGLVDERFVSIDSEFSNEKMISHILLQNVAKDAKLYGMVQNIQDYMDNLKALNKSYEELIDSDIVLLGMGTDGHTASIFPEDQSSKKCMHDDTPKIRNTNAPNHPEKRISLNKPFISNSKHIFLMITGDDKRKTFIQANTENHPIHCFKKEISEVYFTTN